MVHAQRRCLFAAIVLLCLPLLVIAQGGTAGATGLRPLAPRQAHWHRAARAGKGQRPEAPDGGLRTLRAI